MTPRRPCPSCQAKLPPLALECPVCGLPLPRPARVRPLLFQASGLSGRAAGARQAISAPAFGRVNPVAVEVEPTPEPEDTRRVLEVPKPPPPEEDSGIGSLWSLARMEGMEALGLAGLNGLLMLIMTWTAEVPIGRLYEEAWYLLLLVHFAISWAMFMVPLTLTGHTPIMGRVGLLVDADQPERRLSFSLFHLVSVLLFPISFLCMVLVPGHRTLSELLTGQEILTRSALFKPR